MPVKKAAKAKQDDVADHDDAAPVSGADAKLAALVEELDVEVESRCQTLESDAARMVSWIRSQYQMQLQKLTVACVAEAAATPSSTQSLTSSTPPGSGREQKKVRGMKVSEAFSDLPEGVDLEIEELKELANKHRGEGGGESRQQEEEEAVPRTPLRVISNANGSQTVLRTTRATAKKASVTGTARKRMATEAPEDPAPRTTRRAAKASGIMAGASSDHAVPATPRTFHKDLPFTPAASKGQASVMGTCMRLPRRGESIMNARGSPMGVRDTDASAQMVLDENNKIDYLAIGMGENEYNVADASVVANLPKEARLKAAQNVLAMQAQLEAMLATLQAGA